MALRFDSEQATLGHLCKNPNDIDALVALGTIAQKTGRLDAASLVLERAAALAPDRGDVQLQLAHTYHDQERWVQAQARYERALALRPNDPCAHEGACYTAMRLGDVERAAYHREYAFRDRALTVSRASSSKEAPTILLFLSAFGGNNELSRYIDLQTTNVVKCIPEYVSPEIVLPPVDGMVNAISDADRNAAGLNNAFEIIKRYSTIGYPMCPIVNAPEKILQTSRLAHAIRFKNIAHLYAPHVEKFSRTCFQIPDFAHKMEQKGWEFPLLVRAPGFHTGQHFELVYSYQEMLRVVERFPGDEFLALEFCDLREADGYVRKYRMMVIDGELYPLHLAIAKQWKVHYRDSETCTVERFRQEEKKFLENPFTLISSKGEYALRTIAAALQIEYAGIDFGIRSNGDIVLFEANATMALPRLNLQVDQGYRYVAAQTIRSAILATLRRRRNTKTSVSVILNSSLPR